MDIKVKDSNKGGRLKKQCSVKNGKVITCHWCGKSGGTLRKDGIGYAHYPSCLLKKE